MTKTRIIMIVIVVATIGTILAIQKGEQAANKRLSQLKIAENANRLAAEAKRAIVEAQQAIAEAKRVEIIARQKAETLRAQIAIYILEAKSLLDAGQYKQAINAAKNVLGQDSNNAEAKVILEIAMVKLKEIAQQQIDALTKQETQKMVEDSDLVPAIPK